MSTTSDKPTPKHLEKSTSSPHVSKKATTDPHLEIQDKVLVRKIDWRICPLLLLCYFSQFIDKQLINYANVMGFQKDLGMKGNDLSWMQSAFFIAYFLAEIPQGMILQKFPVHKALAVNLGLWGVVVACTAAVQNFGGLLACRIILGCLEAVIIPALMLVTTMWYKRTEATPRYGIWFCGMGLGQIVGGLISFAFQHVDDPNLHSWRAMFICLGGLAILAGIVVYMFLPQNPAVASFLTPEERDAVLARVAENKTGIENRHFRAYQLFEAVYDPKLWVMFLLLTCSVIPSGVIVTYSAILISGFGYDPEQSALLNIPSGAVSIVASIVSTYVAIKGVRRWISVVGVTIPALIGGALMSFMPKNNKPGLLLGIYLVNFTPATAGLVYAWVGQNTAGHTKKITASALMQMGFAVANIVGPQTFQAKDMPNGYLPARITILVAMAVVIVLAMALAIMYRLENMKRDRGTGDIEGRMEESDDAWTNLTDGENRAFRYHF